MWVVAVGNAFDGLVLFGLFTTVDGAREWAEINVNSIDWTIVELEIVEDASEWDAGWEV